MGGRRARGDDPPSAAAPGGGAVAPHWLWQVCGRPVGRDGYVALFNANAALGPVGTHSVAATPNAEWRQRQQAEAPPAAGGAPARPPRPAPPRLTPEGVVPDPEHSADPACGDCSSAPVPWPARRPPDVGIRVVHAACDAGAHRRPFWVPPPPTLEAWCGFVLGMERLPWMGRGDLLRLLAFWWRHEGRGVPRP